MSNLLSKRDLIIIFLVILWLIFNLYVRNKLLSAIFSQVSSAVIYL